MPEHLGSYSMIQKCSESQHTYRLACNKINQGFLVFWEELVYLISVYLTSASPYISARFRPSKYPYITNRTYTILFEICQIEN